MRPELGHSTNAGIVVGRRELTKGRFYDRRLFLPHYDPFNDDDVGTNLATVLAPALVVGSDISNPNPNHNPNHPNHSNHPKPNQVGSGISLEYFFSTTDGGAGTKVPVSVVSTLTLTLTHP